MNPSDPERSELDTVDDAALNEYLRRDSAVSQRYRELDAAAVPPALDEAVLAQAKAAVADKKVSRWRGVTRWSAPLALAASVVVVVSIVLQPSMQNELSRTAGPLSKVIRSDQYDSNAAATAEAKKERSRQDAAAEKTPVMTLPQDRLADTPPAAQLSMPAPSPAQTPAPVSAAAAESEEKAKQSVARPQSSSGFAAPRMQPQAIAPAAPPPPEDAVSNGNRAISSQENASAPALSETRVTARRREGADLSEEVIITGAKRPPQPGAGAGPRGTVLPSREGAAAADQSSGKPFDRDQPDSWLDYIRRLRARGEASRADTEWSRFRRQYPDFNVDNNDAARPGRR